MSKTDTLLSSCLFHTIHRVTNLNFCEKNKGNKTELAQGGFELVRGFLPRRARLGAAGKESGLSGPRYIVITFFWKWKPTGSPGLNPKGAGSGSPPRFLVSHIWYLLLHSCWGRSEYSCPYLRHPLANFWPHLGEHCFTLGSRIEWL